MTMYITTLLADYLICRPSGAHINKNIYVAKGHVCLCVPANHSELAVEVPELHSFHREAALPNYMLCMHLKCIHVYMYCGR